MRAYVVPDFGAPGTVGERPTPEPGAGEILVRVKAASVNAVDPILLSGAYKDFMEHRFPFVPGSDYAGTVVALGRDVGGFAVGDEVFGAVGKAHVGEGSFAESVTANAALAFRRPNELSAESAAALPLAGGTALAEVDAAEVGDGDTVLIVGSGGGVGAFATQLAARRGARVIAVTKPEQADEVRRLGASEVLDYTAGDLVGQVRAVAPDGVTVLIDHFHDAAGLVPIAAVVQPGGRIVSPIAMGGAEALADLPVTFHLANAALGRVDELAEAATRGELDVAVETFPLDQTADALARQMTRQARGKLVVVIDQQG